MRNNGQQERTKYSIQQIQPFNETNLVCEAQSSSNLKDSGPWKEYYFTLEVGGFMLLRNGGNYFIIDDIKYCKS
jgi:hypothetical protein